MAERPIIFSGKMVRAILADRKTMTRRLAWRFAPIKHEACDGTGATPYSGFIGRCDGCGGSGELPGNPSLWQRIAIGDRLWVRERWSVAKSLETAILRDRRKDWIVYSAEPGLGPNNSEWAIESGSKWRPSIHMPRWASRLTLEVTAVKIERLQEISEDDARAEGVEPAVAGHDERGPLKTYRTGFVRIWNSLHGDDAWLANPEVVAISFQRIERADGSADAR